MNFIPLLTLLKLREIYQSFLQLFNLLVKFYLTDKNIFISKRLPLYNFNVHSHINITLMASTPLESGSGGEPGDGEI